MNSRSASVPLPLMKMKVLDTKFDERMKYKQESATLIDGLSGYVCCVESIYIHFVEFVATLQRSALHNWVKGHDKTVRKRKKDKERKNNNNHHSWTKYIPTNEWNRKLGRGEGRWIVIWLKFMPFHIPVEAFKVKLITSTLITLSPSFF